VTPRSKAEPKTGPKTEPKTERPRTARVDPQHMWVLLLSTIRYSMGRQTYMPAYCTELYHCYRRSLTLAQRAQIAEEIERELDICKQTGHKLGAMCDDAEWTRLAAEIRKELPCGMDRTGRCNISSPHA